MDTIPSIKTLTHVNPEEENKKDDETEEINQIFEGQGPYSEEFSIGELSQNTGSSVWIPGYVGEGETVTCEVGDHIRVRDAELNFHRRDSFPHVHHPLKPSIYHKKSRKRSPKHEKNEERAEEDSLDKKIVTEGKAESSVLIDVGDSEHDDNWLPKSSSNKEHFSSKVGKFSPHSHKKRTGTNVSLISIDDDLEMSPLLSPDVARLRSCIRSETDTGESEDESPMLSADSRKKGRVQFDIGSDAADSEHEKKSKPYKKRRSSRRKAEYEDPNWRRQTGSEKHKPERPFVATTEDEAHHLKEHELNDISTHRFEDQNVRRRHTVRAKSSVSSFFHPSSQHDDSSQIKEKIPIIKKTFDHNPHEVFVELAELQPTSVGGLEWKETARWIKYEEDVEGVDNRWGKPHIAFLNFNALFSLRKGLERGAVLLDLDERDLPSVATRVVDHMVACDQIPPEQRDAVIKILLLRHRHIKENFSAFRRASRGSKMHLLGASEERLQASQSATSLDGKLPTRRSFANILHSGTFSNFHQRRSIDENTLSNGGKPSSRRNSVARIDIESDTETREKRVLNLELLKKLPEGAEATAVLVGAVEFLQHPTIAFVRLAEGVIMENVVEVPIPVRFFFVLLGPYNEEMDYHEVGRSISTLMSDKSFHEVAYKAHSRGQLLSAINDFLNASLVFPPSEWKNKDLVPIDEIRAKTAEIRKKNEEVKAKKRQIIKKAPDAPSAPIPGVAEDGDKPPPRDPLIRKGKLFYGLIQDVKIRHSQYLSDFKDGLSPQVLSACIFIFFATLSPAITFGGMYSDLTDRYIGVGETLLVTSINGLIFALFAAQPLLIVGATGPLMIFDMSLLQFCESMDLDFLSIRAWVGMWILLIGLLVAAFEAVTIVKKFTRFTEEIFSTLVCIIFIYGAFEKLSIIFKNHPLQSYEFHISNVGESPLINRTYDIFEREEGDQIDFDDDEEDFMEKSITGIIRNGTFHNSTISQEEKIVLFNQPNTALLSMCLMLGTFLIAWKLKHFRNSKYLGRGIRRALGDFGVPIAIFLMVLLDYLIQDTYTDKLSMPEGLEPSNSEVRGWLINPFGVVKSLPVWCMIAAAPASLLLFVLIFIEENICHLILSKPERCLKKGSGFHLDIVLSCFINTLSGFLGAPFMGPACVRTIAHMSSLTVMSSNVAPGESPKIVGCIEQRVSALTVSALIGLSVMLYAVLNLVPTSVLLGIFLYMGISATAGIQLLERFILFFVPVKHHPNVPYVKKVRTRKMHAFTLIQLLMLAILWMVKQSPAALAIPFVLLCLIPLRLYLLPLLFTSVELIALDGKDQSSLVDGDDEADFYEAAHSLPTQIESDHPHKN
ncbi:UNVERIFIED_CONTAM: hypothetical protein RMT77_012206 [Armadillidium vulgare]